MKKIILLFLIALILPVEAKSATMVSNDRLIYNVEKVKFDSGKLKIKGWAYVNQSHSISGKTYKISVIAVRSSEAHLYSESSSIDKKTATISYSGGKWKGYEVDDYLYATTCRRTSPPTDICIESYHNLNNDKIRLPFDPCQSGTCVTTSNTAKCSSGGGDSCIINRPYFEAEFDVNELKDKFSYEEITFLIKINFFDSNGQITNTLNTSGCRYSSGYICSNSFNKYMFKRIAVDDATVEGITTVGKQLDSVNAEISSKFHMPAANLNRIQSGSGNAQWCSGTTCAKFSGGNYNIKSSKMIESSDDGGLPFNYSLRYYELYLAGYWNGNAGTVGSANTGWALSTWGEIQGEFNLTFSPSGKKPNPKCNNPTIENNDNCSNNDTSLTGCQKLFSYSPSRATTTLVNYPGDNCPSKGYYRIEKIYTFDEKNTLKMNTDFTNSGLGYHSGTGFNHYFDLTRDITWKAESDIYYFVAYYYRNAAGNCVMDEGSKGYVNREFLTDGRGISLPTEAEINAEFVKIVNKEVNKTLKNIYSASNEGLSYNYPDSNDVNKRAKDENSEYINIPNIAKDGSGNVTEIPINSQNGNWTKTYNYKMLNAYIRRSDSFKDYSSTLLDASKYLDGKENYYIPFNAYKYMTEPNNSSAPLRFYTTIENSSIIEKMVKSENIELRSKCYLKVKSDGNSIENLTYRVININDPFPNYKPGQLDADGKKRATNWETVWKKGTKFNGESATPNYGYLKDRILESDVEKYIIELFPDNIEYIRKYNDCKVSACKSRYTPSVDDEHYYITNNITENGVSRFVRDNIDGGSGSYHDKNIFKRIKHKMSKLGEFDSSKEGVLS